MVVSRVLDAVDCPLIEPPGPLLPLFHNASYLHFRLIRFICAYAKGGWDGRWVVQYAHGAPIEIERRQRQRDHDDDDDGDILTLDLPAWPHAIEMG